MSRVNKYRALKKEPKAYVHGWNGGDQTKSIWVYGSAVIPIYINTYPTKRMEMVIDVNYDELDYWQPSYSTCEIIPNTVGQYIGVDDKNGKEIYEKDIVKRKMFDDYVIGQVVWFNMGFCGFMLKCGNSYYHIGKSEHTGISDCDEVIGNVYENADLLEEVDRNE